VGHLSVRASSLDVKTVGAGGGSIAYSVSGAISHSNDRLVLLPIFKDGRLIA